MVGQLPATIPWVVLAGGATDYYLVIIAASLQIISARRHCEKIKKGRRGEGEKVAVAVTNHES